MLTETIINGNIIEYDNTMTEDDIAQINQSNTVNENIDCIITDYSSKFDENKKQFVKDKQEFSYYVPIDESKYLNITCTGYQINPCGVTLSPQSIMDVRFLLWAECIWKKSILLPTYDEAFEHRSDEDRKKNVPIVICNNSLKVQIKWIHDQMTWNIKYFYVLPHHMPYTPLNLNKSETIINENKLITSPKSKQHVSFVKNESPATRSTGNMFKKIKRKISPSPSSSSKIRGVPPLDLSGHNNEAKQKQNNECLSPRKQIIVAKQEMIKNKQGSSSVVSTSPKSAPLSPKRNFASQILRKRSSISHESKNLSINNSVIQSPNVIVSTLPQIEKDINVLKLSSVSKELKISEIQQQLDDQNHQIKEMQQSINFLIRLLQERILN